MKILYLVSKYATVFGTLIKGLWEHIACGIMKIFVEDGRYLQPNELCGHVEHTMCHTRPKAFMVAFFPGLINAVLAFLLGGAGFMGLFILKVNYAKPIFWVYAVLLYLGISFFCNIFPLFEDALNNWDLLYKAKLSPEDKKRNAEILEKNKALKAYEKEAKKLAKQQADKAVKTSAKINSKAQAQELELIKGETNIVAKVLLFIPSAIIYAGSLLEKYGITFIISIIATVLAIVLS